MTVLAVSFIFNFFLYSEIEIKSKQLVISLQNEQLAINKNNSLSKSIEALEISRIENQKVADDMKTEISQLTKKSQKTITIIKEAIRYESCNAVSIAYPDSVSMQYD